MAETKAKPAQQYLGTGRRKTSVARVRLSEGTGQVRINGRPLNDFFTEIKDRNAVVGPLQTTEMQNRLDITATVQGGGITGQAGAVCQGVARAEDDVRPRPGRPGSRRRDAESAMSKKLRDSGFLMGDGRMKERKKYGRKGA